MAHINLPSGLPGIIGPMTMYPHTAKHLNGLAEALLVEETSTFPKAERELVASYVSYLNNCVFCSESHGAVANVHSQKDNHARNVWNNPLSENISEKMKLMLVIAKKVKEDARTVLGADLEKLRELGATERDCHDLILIAASFCMFNRYVDGLGTFAPPREDGSYIEMGKMLATKGYARALE